jgi:hypothetical protein
MIYVHYSKTQLRGDEVLPLDTLTATVLANAGHHGRVHKERFPEQYRSDRVYVHELPSWTTDFNLGTLYSESSYWVYEVEPIGELERDPEYGGHLASSLMCPRARVLRCVRPGQ